jgi:2-keto-3-deoxy-L-rhamnonate aldolase RhmA
VRVSLRVAVAVTLATALPGAAARAQQPAHLNPMIDLHAAGQPVLGLYAPSNPRPRPAGVAAGAPAPGGGASSPAPARPASAIATPPLRSPAELARDALGYTRGDFIFDGSMEHDFDGGYPGFAAFMQGLAAHGVRQPGASPRLRLPVSAKTPPIAPDPALAAARIARQLDLGVSTIVFVDVESAAELEQGLAAMRFAERGGTRPAAVGSAPAFWGVSESEYRRRADLWPLAPEGELTAWAIVESREGLARVREIAATKGIAALFPGAGTLRGVFTTIDPTTKERRFDAAGWEAAIQQVLSACKEFAVPCGYPANDPATVEQRMREGFRVFIAGWGESGFRAVEHGRTLGGR